MVFPRGWFGLPLALFALLREAVFVYAWWLAAVGFGAAASRVFESKDPDRIGCWMVRAGLGAAILSMGFWVCGLLGGLNVFVAWAWIGVGMALAIWRLSAEREDLKQIRAHPLPWSMLLVMPVIGLLGVAATVAAGVLWQPTEAGGYDVLTYHLQLPKQWLATGQITGDPSNAYSYMPNLWEAVYAHMALLRGGVIEGAIAAQLLHASMAVGTAKLIAWSVARLASDSSSVPEDRAIAAGVLAGAVYLALPWVLVTGSMAYNEQAAAFFGVAAWMMLSRPGHVWQQGAGAGLLVGAAILTKLTSIGFVAAPLALAVWVRGDAPRVDRAKCIAAMALVSGLVFSLWLIRNSLWVGMPTFPLLTEVFGTAHWTAEQAARWNAAHSPHTPMGEAIKHLFSAARGLFHTQFAWLIWPMALIGAGLACRHATRRRAALALCVVLGVQVLFWILKTHHMSRFLLPLAWSAAMLIGLGLASCSGPREMILRVGAVITIGVALIMSWSLWVAQVEGHAALFIDAPELRSDRLAPDQPLQTFEAAANELPAGSKIYAEAYATPLYVRTPIDHRTVWDGSPLGRALAEGGHARAKQWLREQGYTHVVIDWTMLTLWLSPGNYGYDPTIQSVQTLEAFARSALKPVGSWPSGIVLYTLRDQ